MMMRGRTALDARIPSATHALRAIPRHLARLTALLRKISLNSGWVNDASFSSSGAKSESLCSLSLLPVSAFGAS